MIRIDKIKNFDNKRYLTEDDLSDIVTSENLSQVAFSGSYTDLEDVPSAFIPPSEKIQFTSSNSQNVTWSNAVATFTHSLNCYPIVSVYDENGEQIYPIITILSGTSFSLNFDTDSNPVGANTWTCVVVYGTRYGNADPGEGTAMSFIPYENGNTTIGGSYRQEITTIPASTTEYSLLEGTYNHIPSSTPTYTLPNVTDTSITHEVMLTVKFTSNVLSYQFRNYSGTQITPSSTPEIQENSVVTFRCTYEALLGNWAVLPIPLGTAS